MPRVPALFSFCLLVYLFEVQAISYFFFSLNLNLVTMSHLFWHLSSALLKRRSQAMCKDHASHLCGLPPSTLDDAFADHKIIINEWMFAFTQQMHEWWLAVVNFLRFTFHIQSLKFAYLIQFSTKENFLGIRLIRLQPSICHEISCGLIFKMGFSFSALLFWTPK